MLTKVKNESDKGDFLLHYIVFGTYQYTCIDAVNLQLRHIVTLM